MTHPQDLGLPLDLGHPERRIDASPGQATHPNAPVRPLSVSVPTPSHRPHRQVIATMCSVLCCHFGVYNKPFGDAVRGALCGCPRYSLQSTIKEYLGQIRLSSTSSPLYYLVPILHSITSTPLCSDALRLHWQSLDTTHPTIPLYPIALPADPDTSTTLLTTLYMPSIIYDEPQAVLSVTMCVSPMF